MTGLLVDAALITLLVLAALVTVVVLLDARPPR
ncbi:hypothetical protein EDD35_0903 [Amycolatopsis thermoflava]|uniref:Uncharacterized protein n=1 Tax=Amycolatopsis thermoflava TaxID=84480 RepID=A0A3N2GQF1_9PSEU|nr:hypothetical protein EDD35_0903 [Amycolatopsis thermoflava]